MGLDLTIMPLWYRSQLGGDAAACYDLLKFDRDYKIFGQIADPNGQSAVPDEGIEAVVNTYPLPPKMRVETYGEIGARKTRKNIYGQEMVYTYAEQMKKLTLPENASKKNRAILAFLNAIEADTPIVLEWS